MVLAEDRDSSAGRKPATDSTSAPTEGLSVSFLAPGQVLGDRYQIRSQLGRGGLGEVWRAFDLKLRVEVALKALREDMFQDEQRRDLLRQEVRAAREVVSPNVCRIFDLIEAGGRELVSMEYVDGKTLLHVLQERGPLELKEAQNIASQLLAGLEAIHKAGLVHRDVKPENIMLTRAGRVAVMDFGLAREQAEGGGTVSGTPAYMAPEQAAGRPVDARADVYSAGVVLAEMVCPEGIRNLQSRQSVWEGIRHEPARVPDSPWAPVLKKAVAKDPEQRYKSAHTLTRALEDVTLRVEGAEDLHPYPGLASFTEADAEYFFGREAEVEQMWARLEGPPRLLGLVGPSGAGKTSFLRAGLVPSASPAWSVVRCTPGTAPFVSLGQALAPAIVGDAAAMRLLPRVHESDSAVELVERWSRAVSHALLVVDQFEELFTLNAEDAQASFGSLLARLPLEADVHVLLSMRDDFLMLCNRHEGLRPVVHGLTLLNPPTGAALRRALTQPALQCGYRFEDDALIEEMLAEVEGERGALPLLAFAAARLWEKRDRETGLLTRQAYQDIGGVGGALARHAEATMDRIGSERIGIVRELFRNLVTAEGTRAVREWDELLSVFDNPLSSRASEASRGIPRAQENDERATTSTPAGDPSTPRPSEGRSAQDDRRRTASEVLRELINARLLTSYEVRQEEGESTRRVEIIHESLLANWPRLVRWLAQDAEGALLRDQLRQAARTWDEHERTDDMLWTGAAFKEYEVWRERYPGGLTELEEAFSTAMTSLANRRRQRRRLAVAAGFAILLAVLAVVGTLWRRSVVEVGRREAAQLLALGRLELADHPNAALAYAIASLERGDNDPARRLAVEALWKTPPARFLSDPVGPMSLAWSPDGRWLALGGASGLALLDREGRERRVLSSSPDYPLGFSSDGRRLVSDAAAGAPLPRVWALPEGQLERTLARVEGSQESWAAVVADSLLTFAVDERAPEGAQTAAVRRLPLDGAAGEGLDRWEVHDLTGAALDPTGTWLLSIQGGRILQQRLDNLTAPGRVIGTHAGNARVKVRPWRDRAVTGDQAGELRVWDVSSARLERTLRSPADARNMGLDPTGRFLAAGPLGVAPTRSVFLFDLASPLGAEPSPLIAREWDFLAGLSFSPDGSWLATNPGGTIILWNMSTPRSTVLARREALFLAVAFTRNGALLATSEDGALTRWPPTSESGEGSRLVWSRPSAWVNGRLELDPAGRFAVGPDTVAGAVLVVPLDGSQATTHVLTRPPGAALSPSVRLSPDGALAAVGVDSTGHPEATGLRVLDLVTGDEHPLETDSRFDLCDEAGSGFERFAEPVWLPDGRLVSDGDGGLRLWDLATGASSLLRPCRKTRTAGFQLLAAPDSRRVLRLDPATSTGTTSSLSVFDLASRTTRVIASHGNRVSVFALDPSGSVLLTGGQDGVVRVGPLTGEEPHLLAGHTGTVWALAVSPDGRRIASVSTDGTIRLWPMPDLSKPPLHTLPYDELLAKLKSLTNLRAVPDPGSDTGWKIEIGPFPGWATVPEWNP